MPLVSVLYNAAGMLRFFETATYPFCFIMPFSFSPRLVWDRRPRNVKKTGLSSAAEDNKRECTISHQDSALFTFKTMEGEKSFFLGELLLFT